MTTTRLSLLLCGLTLIGKIAFGQEKETNVVFNEGLVSRNSDQALWVQYSRVNDDFFVTEDGGTGNAYEVSLQTCSLSAKKQNGNLVVEFGFYGQIVTGRWVESARAFELREVANSVRTPAARAYPIQIKYPNRHVHSNSTRREKIDSLIFAKVPLGIISRPGEFSGELQVKTREDLGIQEEQLRAFKKGVFQNISWKLKVEKKQKQLEWVAKESDIDCRRAKTPFLLTWASNFKPIKTPRRYPKATRDSHCFEETVAEDRVEIVRSPRELVFASAIRSSGCLYCHGKKVRQKDGKRIKWVENADNYRFCRNGTPLNPGTMARFLDRYRKKITEDPKWAKDNYGADTRLYAMPRGFKSYTMSQALRILDQLDNRNKSVSRWMEWQLKSPENRVVRRSRVLTEEKKNLNFSPTDGIACVFSSQLRNAFMEIGATKIVSPPGYARTLGEALRAGCLNCLGDPVRSTDPRQRGRLAYCEPYYCEGVRMEMPLLVPPKLLEEALVTPNALDGQALRFCRIVNFEKLQERVRLILNQ